MRAIVAIAAIFLLISTMFLSPFGYLVDAVINFWGLQDSVENLNTKATTDARLKVALFLGNITVTIVAGAVVYILVSGAQAENTKMTLNIERLNTLHFLEKDIEDIFHEKSVLQIYDDNGNERYIEYMSVFKEDWKFPSTKKPELVREQRVYDLGGDGELVASRSLYKSLNWFRRLERAYQAKVVKREDVAALWRQVIPFTTQNRYNVYCDIFSEEDVMPIKHMGSVAWAELLKSDRDESIREVFQQIDSKIGSEITLGPRGWIRRCFGTRLPANR